MNILLGLTAVYIHFDIFTSSDLLIDNIIVKILIQLKKNLYEEEMDRISGGKKENVYKFTPGWLLYRWYVFRDRDQEKDDGRFTKQSE
jgi:hypothetical protein